MCPQIQENSISDSRWSPSWYSGLRAVKRSEQRPHPTFAPSYVSGKHLSKKCKQAEEAEWFGRSTTDTSLLLLITSLLPSTDAGLFHLSFSQLQIGSSANVSSGFHKKALCYIHLMKLHTHNLYFLVVWREMSKNNPPLTLLLPLKVMLTLQNHLLKIFSLPLI